MQQELFWQADPSGQALEPSQRRTCMLQIVFPPWAVRITFSSNKPGPDRDQQTSVYSKQNCMVPFIVNSLFQLELIWACGLIWDSNLILFQVLNQFFSSRDGGSKSQRKREKALTTHTKKKKKTKKNPLNLYTKSKYKMKRQKTY